MGSCVILDELSDLEDILCVVDALFVDASHVDPTLAHALDMKITQVDLIDALLDGIDAYIETWIVDSIASYHVTPIKECFSTFHAGRQGYIYLGNDYAYPIEGYDTVHLCVDGANDLVLHDVRYVLGIKKSLLSVGQMDVHGYSMLFEKGSWKLTRGSLLIVKGVK